MFAGFLFLIRCQKNQTFQILLRDSSRQNVIGPDPYVETVIVALIIYINSIIVRLSLNNS